MAPKQGSPEQQQQQHEAAATAVASSSSYDYLPTDIDVHKGLTTAQVQALHNQWGPNTIPAPKVPAHMVFVRQFTGFLPLCIAAAAFVSLAAEGKKENKRRRKE